MRKLFALGVTLAIATTLIGCKKKSEESSGSSDNDVENAREKIVQNFCEAFRVCDGKLLMSYSMSKPADAGIQDENSLLPFMFTVALSDEPVKTKVLKSHTDDERSVSIIEATCNNPTGLDGVPTCLYFYVGHENKKGGKDKGDKITGIATDKEFISKTIKTMEDLERAEGKKTATMDDSGRHIKANNDDNNVIRFKRYIREAAQIARKEGQNVSEDMIEKEIRKFKDMSPSEQERCLAQIEEDLNEVRRGGLSAHRAKNQKMACISNMKALQTAGESWKTKGNNYSKTPTLDDLCGPEKYLMRTPTCPSGGRYEIRGGRNGEIEVYCSSHGNQDGNMYAQ